MNIANTVRFGAKILIERPTKGEAFNVALRHVSEFSDLENPNNWAETVEPKTQPFAHEGRYVVGILTGSDAFAFSQKAGSLNPDEFRNFEQSYFTPVSLATFQPEAMLSQIQGEIIDLSA